jgi:hypothetical protein
LLPLARDFGNFRYKEGPEPGRISVLSLTIAYQNFSPIILLVLSQYCRPCGRLELVEIVFLSQTLASQKVSVTVIDFRVVFV